ncbi:Rpn family recombination-promoting nuclease/putative transposase [Petroclostridium sp. X23]|jgi:predicted transposase/invertase (TIGR01784 family)|uniref:Rpn family recombination-promoting nuclease/putative transposase n=1 Tax=Petroclostridium sp. X23 TaxID=3045146 RepID=UPI0024AD2B77|nr:Rpn family recombination-promoting nuclease/putative transposase [Petroclostridium sp. X23]WHH57491.1 Rpn family recombination-promoting nuclease/putative transposase [Petroclostridium sp. X23]
MGTKKLIRFDWAIKYMLRNKVNFDVLEAFLSNLLREKIIIEEILESESNQEAENRKFNRVDLKCKDSKGEQIIIEVQNQREADYLQRLLWGTSKAVVESIELGEKFSGVVKVISISILYHTMRLDEKENTDFIYYGSTELVGLHTKKPLVLHESIAKGEKVPLVTSKDVFPEYYMIYVEKFNDMVNEDIDEWVYFFKHGEIRDDFKSPGILLAAKKLDYMMMGEKERRAYDDYLAYLGQELGILETAKEEGREEGREEKAIEIAKNLLDILDDELISLKTALSIEKVKALRDKA